MLLVAEEKLIFLIYSLIHTRGDLDENTRIIRSN